MRVFWALIAVLVVAAGATMLLRGSETPPPALPETLVLERAELPPAPPAPSPQPAQAKPGEPPAPASIDTALSDAAKDAGVKVDLPTPAASAPAPAPVVVAPESAKPAEPAPAPAVSAPAAPAPVERHEPDPLAEGDGAAALLALPDVPVGVAISRQDDGSLLLDNRFVVRGEGTAEKPYEIAWEFLVSTSETYKPRLGQKKLPDWLELINNKYVRITGFIAFPLMAQSPDEMLVMLNQWDGCCIGVPPTPYDAVEIKLKNAVRGDDRLKTFGTVEGLFSVDPYLVKDWLIGLYLMKDAKLINTTGNQTSPHVTKPQP
jgi:hypothetical protein